MESAVVQRMQITSNGIKGEKDRDRLESEIGSIEGVRGVDVDPSNHTVEVTFDSTLVDMYGIRRAFEDAGYKIESAS
jgi:copper chaperone CopZ